MFKLKQPSMGLNDPRHHLKVQMWNTWTIGKSETRDHILDWCATVARGTSAGKLRNLVFSCHGAPSYLQMGQGFDRRHTGLFRKWRGLVHTIWFRSCSVARIQTANAPVTGDGNRFCCEVSKAANCFVIASTETQWATSGATLPFGMLDTFEGLLLCYGPPRGEVVWQARYPSQWRGD